MFTLKLSPHFYNGLGLESIDKTITELLFKQTYETNSSKSSIEHLCLRNEVHLFDYRFLFSFHIGVEILIFYSNLSIF